MKLFWGQSCQIQMAIIFKSYPQRWVLRYPLRSPCLTLLGRLEIKTMEDWKLCTPSIPAEPRFQELSLVWLKFFREWADTCWFWEHCTDLLPPHAHIPTVLVTVVEMGSLSLAFKYPSPWYSLNSFWHVLHRLMPTDAGGQSPFESDGNPWRKTVCMVSPCAQHLVHL